MARKRKRARFGSSNPVHVKKTVRGARLAAKIARHSIAATKHGRCSDALDLLTRAYHAQGVSWGHFVSLGPATRRYNVKGRRRSIAHGAGKIASKVGATVTRARAAFHKVCLVK